MEEESISHLNSNLANTQTCDPVKVRENSGLVREGYKMTKLGWIPEVWEVVKFNKIASFNPKSDSLPESFIYIDLESVKDGILQKRTILKKDDAPSRAQRLLKKNDVLFQTVRPYQKNNLFFQEEGDFVASTGYAQIRAKYNSRFIFHLIQVTYFNNQVLARCTGTSFPAISAKDLSNVLIKLPTLPEQQKIATILSTWDSVIAKQEQLIIAKQEFKKGLMQLLLTGKKRFEGFEREWELKFLSDIMTIGNGRDYKHLSPGDIPVYGTGGIMRYVNDYLFDGESVGIGRKGTIDKPVFLQGKFWTVDTLFYCHSFKESLALYVYYLFLTINWKNYNEASGVPSLSQNTIKKIIVSLPSVKEQQKIASVLSAADKEIGLLQSELATFRGQKRGLMQRLLTGEVRVEIN